MSASAPPIQARATARTDADTATVSSVREGAVFGVMDSRVTGLTRAEVDERLARFGRNDLVEVRARSVLPQLLSQFTHVMAILLWAGGLLAFLAGLAQLGVAVWLVNLLNGAFSFWQEHRAERAVAALRTLLPRHARVIRDGREEQVTAEQLVPGDVLLVEAGDRISADARLVEVHELRVDQSALTGEQHPARRSSQALPAAALPLTQRTNLVFAGTSATSGRGKAVVFATGMATEFGSIAGMTQSMRRELSPLQRELATLTRIVGLMAVLVGVTFFVLAQLLTPMPLARGLIFALGMIVAFVPEGLLPTVTLALAMGTQRMARRNALVKRLSAVEALGSTTVICTDKTGTLTANQMTVRAVFQLDATYEFSGVGYDPTGEVTVLGKGIDDPPAELRELLTAAALANDARLVAPSTDDPSWSVIGDPTDGALLVAAVKAGCDVGELRANLPRIDEWAFDSSRKRISTLHRQDDGYTLAVKGAPQPLLERCAYVRVDGREVPLEDTHRLAITTANDDYSRNAFRVIAVAVGKLGSRPRSAEDAEQNLVFLGLTAMLDPPRKEIHEAVATCHRAGIRILMMTGDYGLTAESIARRVGIVPPGGSVRIVNGDEIDTLSDDELATVLADPVLFARSTPAHKLRVVEALQRNGEVVAVTGDGVNDAPALKRADIGVAMGASGTDVAREAADMVLLDDDFSSIVAAIEEGRAVYANIRKFTGYIFTSNTPEAVPFVLFGLSAGRIPIALDVMHILAVDLGTDLAPALALGGEPPEEGIMDRPPRRRDEHLITPALLRRSYLWLGPVQAAAVMLAFYAAFWALGYRGWLDLPTTGPAYAAATGAALAAVVTTQIGNLLAHRTDRVSLRKVGFGRNRLIWYGIASEIVIIAIFLHVPPVARIIGTGAFPLWLWFPLIAVSPLLLVVDEFRKARRRSHDLQEVQP